MILNAYSVLTLFVALLEFALGTFVVWGSIAGIRRLSARERGDEEASDAGLGPVLLSGGVLLGVSVAGWPLLYLLLASYVPQWEDVMCIQGVVKIGAGSPGPAGWLPLLVETLQATKPLLLFATGAAWLVHLANRATRTAPLSRRLLGVAAAAGLVALVDAGAAAAYVVIPKEDGSLSRGCCTVTMADLEPVKTRANEPAGAPPHREGTGLLVGFYAATLSMAGWTFFASRAKSGGPVKEGRGTAPLFAAVVASLPIGVIFLRDVAAPAFLGRPEHRCAYCLVSTASPGLWALGLYVLGIFATGWACLLRWFAGVEECREFLPRRIAILLRWGAAGWLGAAFVTALPLLLHSP